MSSYIVDTKIFSHAFGENEFVFPVSFGEEEEMDIEM